MSQQRKERRQNISQFSPGRTVRRDPSAAASLQRATPASVPKRRARERFTRRSSMHTTGAPVVDHEMEDLPPVTETVAEAEAAAPVTEAETVAEGPLATDLQVDSPWLTAGLAGLTKQVASDGWSGAPETEQARLLAWELCQKTRATKDWELTKSAEKACA
jgi:hypothetical protein